MSEETSQPEPIETPVARLIRERIERIAATPREGYVDGPLTRDILNEETRKLHALIKAELFARMAPRIAGLRDAAEIERIMTEEIHRFFADWDAGKFHPPPLP